jgi:hypothetical protein
MYNMDISLFGFKLNLEVLILIGIVYMILVSHTVCSCCDVPGIIETFGNLSSGNKHSSGSKKGGQNKQSGSKSQGGSSSGSSPVHKLAAAKMLKNQKEGFTGANTNYGQSAPYSLADYSPVDTSKWGAPDLTVVPGQPLSPAVQQILNREPQPVPLPEGEMLMFANTPFKPECNSAYSNSSGMACLTTSQYNYLVTRGGNNVPYSEY